MSRIKRPSPALVVAMLALVAAIAVPAFALTKSEKRVIKKIANAQITKRAPGLAAVGRSNFGPGCTDDAHTGEACISVALEVPRRARVLVVASGVYAAGELDDLSGPGSGTDGTTHVEGSCRITIDGTAVGAAARTRSFEFGERAGLALNRVTLPLDPGTYTFAMRCFEADGDIDWIDPSISAVMLGSG